MNTLNLTRTQLTAMFLQTSVKDSEADFRRALTNSNFPRFDVVAITASNEHQAETFRAQLATRELPKGTEFVVIPDRNGERVGSGGATLSVIKYIKEKYGSFSGLRIACLHSGGDGKRTPNYSALGKLFSPVPRLLPNGKPSTLFDEFMISIASVPGRMNEGMLLLSGDVLLLFNPLQIDFSGHGAAAISFKEDVETGKDHGVFLGGKDGNVKRFLHKQSVETLKNLGAVDERNGCSIDTGAIIFAPDMLEDLYTLVPDDEGVDKYINTKTRLSLYGDFLYPLATDSTLEAFYDEKPEGEFCDELTRARGVVWNILSKYNLKLLNLAPAKFIHFGTTREVMALMNSGWKEYADIGWNNKISCSISGNVAGYNSIISNGAEVGEGTYAEVSYIHHNAKIGKNSLLSFIDIHDETVPDNVVLHGIKQQNGKFVCRIYGVNDNPKEAKLFGVDFGEISSALGSERSLVVPNGSERPLVVPNGSEQALLVPNGSEQPSAVPFAQLINQFNSAPNLWTAEIYPECDTIKDAVASALELYDIIAASCKLQITSNSAPAGGGVGNADRGGAPLSSLRATSPKGEEFKSLCSGFNDADPQAIIDWIDRMNQLVRMENLSKAIKNNAPATEAKAILDADKLTKIQLEWLSNQIARLDMNDMADFSKAIRLYWYIGRGIDDESYQAKCFKLISDTILKSTINSLEFNDKAVIANDKTVVKLPLRVNWGGGWTDTPPHCIEQGGKVLNAAIKLNGELPVEVTIIKIPEKKIVFDSRDMDVHGEFSELEPLQDTGNPFDPFALQKACLLACGIIPSASAASNSAPCGGGVGNADRGGAPLSSLRATSPKGEEATTLESILTRMGGGFEMHSEVTNVPKGSGLGTSSILSAACVKAVFEFIGKDYTDNDLYQTVLAMEQIMSTGGGWQDQVGGVTNGIKFITSEPGINQVINVEKVEISDETKKELSDRFCLIYTGQRRLARNLLRDVVGRYVGNEPDSIFAHKEIQIVADKMRAALENGDVDEFAHLLSYHWELSNKIDDGTTNTLLDQILLTVDDMTEGKFVSGAGGGGFLQIILKKGIKKEEVHTRLKEIFQDFAVDLWDCEIVY